MNIYKISYKIAGIGETSTEVRGRNEAEAKKNFKATEIGKATPINSVTVELIRENELATKQEERDTLAVIRQMVEELGPQSYLATAFEGCFRDAEDNIEDDAAYSMKSRFEYSEEKLAAALEENKKLKAEVEYAKVAQEHWEAEKEQLRAAQLYSSLQDKLVELLEERVSNCDTKCFDITQQLITAEPDDFQRLQEKAKKVMADRANYSNTLRQVQAIKCE